MAESMAQGFVGGPGGHFPYGLLASEHMQAAMQHAMSNQGNMSPEIQHLLQHSATQVFCPTVA